MPLETNENRPSTKPGMGLREEDHEEEESSMGPVGIPGSALTPSSPRAA